MKKRKNKVFEGIMQGAREAVAFAKGEADLSAYRVHVPARPRSRRKALRGSAAETKAPKAKTFASVWDAIESAPAEAASMKARSGLMIAIRTVVDAWDATQAESAKRLGISQPRLNDLLRGRIDKFSLDALVDLASRAGLSVQVKVRRAA